MGWRGLKAAETGSSLHCLARSSCRRPSKTPKCRRKPGDRQHRWGIWIVACVCLPCLSYTIPGTHILWSTLYNLHKDARVAAAQTGHPQTARFMQPQTPADMRLEYSWICLLAAAVNPPLRSRSHREYRHLCTLGNSITRKASPTSFPASTGWLHSR